MRCWCIRLEESEDQLECGRQEALDRNEELIVDFNQLLSRECSLKNATPHGHQFTMSNWLNFRKSVVWFYRKGISINVKNQSNKCLNKGLFKSKL